MADDARRQEAIAAREDACELVSAAEIREALDRIASELTARLDRACPVLLAVMRGGMFAASELARRLDFPYEIDYVHLSRYGDGLRGGSIEWIVRPRPDLRGRQVIVVDDILDHGHTLDALLAALAEVGVAGVSTAVLVVKDRAGGAPRPPVDHVGVHVGDRYVFGCGMDYKGFWRGLPALYAASRA